MEATAIGVHHFGSHQNPLLLVARHLAITHRHRVTHHQSHPPALITVNELAHVHHQMHHLVSVLKQDMTKRPHHLLPTSGTIRRLQHQLPATHRQLQLQLPATLRQLQLPVIPRRLRLQLPATPRQLPLRWSLSHFDG